MVGKSHHRQFNKLVIFKYILFCLTIFQDNSVDRGMASRLLEVLMRQCHHDTRPVLKNNLEVLKTLVEVWKSRIEVPTK